MTSHITKASIILVSQQQTCVLAEPPPAYTPQSMPVVGDHVITGKLPLW